MSTSQAQNQNSAEQIKEEVRHTIRHLTELTRTQADFDEFCGEVLGKLIQITGAHGALFWQINGQGVPKLTHHSGKAPHDQAREILSQDNEQHSRLILDVVRQKMALGVASEAFTGKSLANPNAPENSNTPENSNASPDSSVSDQPNGDTGSAPFLMLLSPVLNRQKDCIGTVELIQRGEVTSQAQEGYLRFLNQISALFQRWHEHQDLAKLTDRSSKWNEKMEFVREVHRSIDFKETTYAIANEARRVLNADRVSVGRWNGKTCKIQAISSQDRFDNRANVVRKLSDVATASVGADSTFWVTGETDDLAPEVAKKINEYLDESHSRTLAVIPLAVRPPDVPDLDMSQRNRPKAKMLGAIVLEYFDDDISEDQIRDECQLIVEQSQLALENARQHNEIFLQPLLKKLGWLQRTLFGDHLKKTITGLSALAILILAMIFVPWELKMKVDGVLHPEVRRHVYSETKGRIENVNFEDGKLVKVGDPLLEIRDFEKDQQFQARLSQRERLVSQVNELGAQMSSASQERREAILENREALRSELAEVERMIEHDREMMASIMEVRAPIDGTVITWNSQQRLNGFVVDPNQTLLTISQLDGMWQLEVKIPHIKVGYVDRALAKAKENGDDFIVAEFAMSTNPNKKYTGQLKKIAIRPHTDDSGIQKYRGIINVDPKDLDFSELRPGAGATVKIFCGKVPMHKAFFHQITDWIKTNVYWF
jgi:biotin carboxyl carrier protein